MLDLVIRAAWLIPAKDMTTAGSMRCLIASNAPATSPCKRKSMVYMPVTITGGLIPALILPDIGSIGSIYANISMANTAHKNAGAHIPKYDRVLMMPSSHFPEYFVDTIPRIMPKTIIKTAVIRANSRVAGK